MSFIEEIERQPLTLSKAAKLIPDRKRNPATLWRWAREGRVINGQRIRLEVLEVGRNILTSRPAMHRFFIRCTQARDLDTSPPLKSDAHESAERELDDMGI